MRIYKLLGLLLVLLIATMPVAAQLNDYTEPLAQNVSRYWAENSHRGVASSYSLKDDYPSLRFDNSLQVGTAVPGATLILLMDMFTVVDMPSENHNFSQQLHNASHYWSKERVWPCLSLNYQHNVKRWLSLGVKSTVGWKSRTERHVVTNEVYQRRSMGIASLLFNMRFSWLHRDWVSMYSSLGVGVMGHFQYNNNWVVPMFDTTWLGIAVGQRVYGYAEFGAGVGGVLRGGIGVRF